MRSQGHLRGPQGEREPRRGLPEDEGLSKATVARTPRVGKPGALSSQPPINQTQLGARAHRIQGAAWPRGQLCQAEKSRARRAQSGSGGTSWAQCRGIQEGKRAGHGGTYLLAQHSERPRQEEHEFKPSLGKLVI